MQLSYHMLADKYGTPLYVYDFDAMTENYQTLKEAFAGHKSLISYAVKANSNLSTIAHFGQLGSGADCVSIGEVKRALIGGIDRYKIIFSGVGKRDDEIEEALREGILLINLESEAEMKRVEMIARRLGTIARISIRVNPNVDPQTHPYISTGLHENKFGVEIDMAKRMYIHAKNSEHLDPVGIHFHIGSQLTDLAPRGGLGVVYDDEIPIDVDAYAQTIVQAIKGMDLTIMMEPGRSMVANAGVLLTRVLYEKENGGKRFVIVDAAMNDLMRPTLYQAYHRIDYLEEATAEAKAADIVGPVCESGDWFGKNVMMPPTEHNDLIAIRSAGAYGFTMASNYNTRGRAAEVAVENGEDRLIRDRENFEDQIRLEKAYLTANIKG